MRHRVVHGHQVRLESAQHGAKAGRQVPQHRVPRARSHTVGQSDYTVAPVSGPHQAVYPRVSSRFFLYFFFFYRTTVIKNKTFFRFLQNVIIEKSNIRRFFFHLAPAPSIYLPHVYVVTRLYPNSAQIDTVPKDVPLCLVTIKTDRDCNIVHIVFNFMCSASSVIF